MLFMTPGIPWTKIWAGPLSVFQNKPIWRILPDAKTLHRNSLSRQLAGFEESGQESSVSQSG